MTPARIQELEAIKQHAQVKQQPGITLAEAERLALIKYPRYTLKHPNPKTGKPDCKLDAQDKETLRQGYMKLLIYGTK